MIAQNRLAVMLNQQRDGGFKILAVTSYIAGA